MTGSSLSARSAAALVLVIVAVGCRRAAPEEPAGPQVLLNRLRVAVVPGGTETVEVTATDENNQPLPFSVESDNEAVASATRTGTGVTVTGQDYGTANVTVSCGSSRTTFPVQVYDPMVLETDELLIKFVDAFVWCWNTSGDHPHVTFWHPAAVDGFRPLGSVATPGFEPATGRAWAVVVKARPGSDALRPPIDYERLWSSQDVRTRVKGTGPHRHYQYTSPGSFWLPVAPDGYQALGVVVAGTFGKPSLDAVVCVREDLTWPGELGSSVVTWRGRPNFWVGGGGTRWEARPIMPPSADPHELCYLPTGAFAVCSLPARVHPSPQCVLRVKLPALVEAPSQSLVPKLAGYDMPPKHTDPLLAKEVLVPWVMVSDPPLPDSTRLRQSPFYRLERRVCYECYYHVINTESVMLPHEVTWEKGISTAQSQTLSQKTGVEVSVETGVSCTFKAIGAEAKIGVTVSRELGYERTTGVEEFFSETIKLPVYTPPGKAVAMWVGHEQLVLKRHSGTDLVPVSTWDVYTRSFANDEYPDE